MLFQKKFLPWLLLLLPQPLLAEEPLERPRIGTHIGVYPSVQFTSDEGFKVGGFSRIFDYGEAGVLPFHSLTTVGAAYAENGTSYVWINYQQKSFSQWKLRTDSELYYTTSSHERYYGIGKGTDIDTSLEDQGFNFYNYEQVNLSQSFRKNWLPLWDVVAGLELDYLRSKANSADTLFAEDFGTDLDEFYGAVFAFSLIHEARNSEFIPSNGEYFATSLKHSPDALNNSDEWTAWQTEFRMYRPILPARKLWLAGQLRYAVSTPSTPLSEKARLGSAATLRGLRQNRFVSNHSASLRGSVRSIWIKTKLFDLPLKGGSGFFIDSGKIGDRFSEIFEGKTHITYGITLFGSYFTDDFLGHCDIGFSDETTLIYLGLGHVY